MTRQQVAVILYRHSGAEAGNEDLLSSYPDGKQVAPYARQAMNWAVSQGLIRGVENGGVTTLSPAATATRAQMAVSMRSCHAGRHLCRRNETGVRRRGNPGLLAGTPEIPNEYYYENQTPAALRLLFPD